MQELYLFSDQFRLLDTLKTSTIRRGHKDISCGNLMFICAATGEYRVVHVYEVYYCRLSDVHPLNIVSENCRSITELLELLRTFYNDISLDDDVTVVNFNVLHN
jgi:hypothetical protein